MHYNLEITLNNTYFDVNVNYNIISYLRQLNTTNSNWYDVRLNKKQINELKTLVKTEEEINFINKIKENDLVDILEHFYF